MNQLHNLGPVNVPIINLLFTFGIFRQSVHIRRKPAVAVHFSHFF